MEAAGRIVSVFQGVAFVEGLTNSFLHEMLTDTEGNPVGFVIGFGQEGAEVLLFSEALQVGDVVYGSGRVFFIPVSDAVVGRVLDGKGKPVDGLGDLVGEMVPVFREAPSILDREPIATPLSTGIKIVDTALPIGRGQRELIVGDRKLGKSTLAIDVVLNQKEADPPVICIYVICGQKRQKLHDLITLFTKHNAFLYSVIVAAPARSSFAELYLAPFLGCAIGEYFRDRGKDALVVYDDLTAHAKAYRSITLIAGRPPGREAYPGDIFSLHASLLERAAKLSAAKGGGSLTALPIAETQEGDISAFIPTNLISITDGQIYFERGLFQKGFLPAVNVGLSVSRVGSAAQPKALKAVTGGIRLALAQHKELQKLAQLETVRSEEARKRIHRGELLLELLKQEKHTKVSWEEQVVLFYAVEEGYFDELPQHAWRQFEYLFLRLLRYQYGPLLRRVGEEGLTEAVKAEVQKAVAAFRDTFLASL